MSETPSPIVFETIPWKRVLCTVRPGMDLIKITAFLQALAADLALFLDPASAALWDIPPFPIFPLEEGPMAPPGLDGALVLGGDGTLLKMAPWLAAHRVPVLGIHRGRLGFLTDTPFEKALAVVEGLRKGAYQIEYRAMLQVRILDADGTLLGSHVALNDAVINAGSIARMIELEVWAGSQRVYRQRADGLIMATPTGSTAYALSAGGPIVSPALDALLLVPMFPHSLSCRPLVLPGNTPVRVHMLHAASMEPVFSADGGQPLALPAHAQIHVASAPVRLGLVHAPGYDYFQVLRDKLYWSGTPNYQKDPTR